jgi:hypothetical protein
MEAITPVELIAALRSTLDLVQHAQIVKQDSPVVRDFKRATSKLIAEVLLADASDATTTQS